MIVQIRPETSDDHNSIRHVNQVAFAGSREADLVVALRAGDHVTVSLVAVVHNEMNSKIMSIKRRVGGFRKGLAPLS